MVNGETVYPDVIEAFAGEQRTMAENLLSPNVSPEALNIDYRDGTVRKRKGIMRLGAEGTADGDDVEAIFQIPTGWYADDFWVAARNHLYRKQGGNNLDSFAALAVDSDRNFRAQLLAYRRLCVVMNGVAENLVCEYADALSLPAPGMSSALTITAAGSGGSINAGVHSYLFSIYNSTTGAESATGLHISSQTAAANDKFTINFTTGGWSPGSYAGADKIRLYRTKAGGTAYYYLTEIAIASTSYQDSAADSTLVTLLDSFHGYAAPSRFGFVMNDTLWLGNQEGEESTLVYTQPGTLADFYSDNTLVIGLGDGDALTGGIGIADRGCVFKRRSTWMVSGAGSSAAVQLLFPGVGCVQHATIAASHDRIYWLGEGGVYSMALPIGAGAPENLTLNGWRDIFQDMTNEDYENCSAVWDARDERYILSLTTDGTRWTMVYCARRQAWALWDVAASGFCVAEGDGPARIYCGWRSWLALFEEGLSDAGYSIDVFDQLMYGVATGGTTTTLVNSAAQWMADMLKDVDVTLVHADGTTETRRVVSNSGGGTTLTVDAVWTAPLAGEVYYLGAITARWRTPRMGIGRWDKNSQVTRVRLLSRRPADDVEAASVVQAYVWPAYNESGRREYFDWTIYNRLTSQGVVSGLCRELVVGVEDATSNQTFDLAGIGLSMVEIGADA